MNIYWHRLFGLLLMDYLGNRGFRVELEKDLSRKRQLLDVVVVEREDELPDLSGICDGFDNLSAHNLISYKSQRQSLNAWAVQELIGHYVNYRKILGKKANPDDIRLYAVSTRYPAKLLKTQPACERSAGVLDISVLSRSIRILVLSRLPLEQRNAVMAFFSFDADKVRFALDHYQWRQDDCSTVINQLLEKYTLEGIAMPYTMEQFRKEYIKAHLHELDPDEILARFDPDKRLKGLDADEVLSRFDSEQRLKGLRPEQRLKGLDADEVLSRFDAEQRLKGLDLERRLKGLDPKDIEAYLKKLKPKKGKDQ